MNSEKKKNITGLLLLAVFALLFIAGTLSGEVETVFSKAAGICLECIGIG